MNDMTWKSWKMGVRREHRTMLARSIFYMYCAICKKCGLLIGSVNRCLWEAFLNKVTRKRNTTSVTKGFFAGGCCYLEQLFAERKRGKSLTVCDGAQKRLWRDKFSQTLGYEWYVLRYSMKHNRILTRNESWIHMWGQNLLKRYEKCSVRFSRYRYSKNLSLVI